VSVVNRVRPDLLNPDLGPLINSGSYIRYGPEIFGSAGGQEGSQRQTMSPHLLFCVRLQSRERANEDEADYRRGCAAPTSSDTRKEKAVDARHPQSTFVALRPKPRRVEVLNGGRAASKTPNSNPLRGAGDVSSNLSPKTFRLGEDDDVGEDGQPVLLLIPLRPCDTVVYGTCCADC